MSAIVSQTAKVLRTYGDHHAAKAECERLSLARAAGQMFYLHRTTDGRWLLVEDWLPGFKP